jgi:putative spermidine/putrescine transport system substrate-binding protein
LSSDRLRIRVGLLMGATLLFAACSSTGGAPSAGASAGDMNTLVANAKKEGSLTTIALPHGWCNYGEALTTFKTKYGININELNPDGSSAQEVDAIKANKTNPGPQAPDVIDVGLGFAPQISGQQPTAAASGQTPGPAEKLVAPYKVATWADIPDSAKDAEGLWYGDYFGVMSFETNTSVVKTVPKSFKDLLDPKYKGQVALSGDPTQSNQAMSGVWASSIASGGSLDSVQQGLDYFKQLNTAGNFVPVIAKTSTVASGETPIRITWSYNGLGDKDSLKGNPPVEVAIPSDAKFGGMYIQAVSAFAPHPNAARLWQEFLYSDEGQLIWLKGYCVPIRYDAMKKAGKIPADLDAKVPDSTGAQLPSLAQITAATNAVAQGWPTVVGVTVK